MQSAGYSTWGNLPLYNLLLFRGHQRDDRHGLDCNIPALQSLKSWLIYKRQWGENETGVAVRDVEQVLQQLRGGGREQNSKGEKLAAEFYTASRADKKIATAGSPNWTEANIITSGSRLQRKTSTTLSENPGLNSLVWYPNLAEKNQHRYFKVGNFYLQIYWQKVVGKFKTF